MTKVASDLHHVIEVLNLSDGVNASIAKVSKNASMRKKTALDIPHPGDRVIIENVTDNKQINGQTGALVSFNATAGRWKVILDSTEEEVEVLPENQRPEPPIVPTAPNASMSNNATATTRHQAEKLWFDTREFLPQVFAVCFPLVFLISTGLGCGGSRQSGAVPADGRHLQDQSLLAIVAITSYKFYIGFLNTTWVPFLIAREGDRLVAEHQAFFMGIEKLIYGFSL